MTDFRRLLYVNAYQVYLGTLHGCAAPVMRALAEVIRDPQPGHLVIETTTIYMPERDDFRFGRLLREAYEPTRTPEELAADGDRSDEPIPSERAWYIELPDGREYRWHNAEFIRVLEDPALTLDALQRGRYTPDTRSAADTLAAFARLRDEMGR